MYCSVLQRVARTHVTNIQVSDSCADVPLEASPLSAGTQVGGIWQGGVGSRILRGAFSEQQQAEDLDTDHHNHLLEGRETYVRILVALTLLHVRHDSPWPAVGGGGGGGGRGGADGR